jgi:hypothetical protein
MQLFPASCYCNPLSSKYRHLPTFAVVMYRKIRHKLDQITDMAKYTGQLSWNTNSKTVGPDWPQWDRPAACVIAQQYSSANFSLRFHSCKETFSSSLFQISLFLKKCGSILFSSVTHSRTPSTYILPSGETPNYTSISHKWKNYSSVYQEGRKSLWTE